MVPIGGVRSARALSQDQPDAKRAARSKYPADWPQIRQRILARSALVDPERPAFTGERCECTGECGEHAEERCQAPNRAHILRDRDQPWMWADGPGPLADWNDTAKPVRIVLTVAHLNQDTTDNRDENLKAMCQRCHLLLDRHQHARNARQTRHRRRAVRDLFDA